MVNDWKITQMNDTYSDNSGNSYTTTISGSTYSYIQTIPTGTATMPGIVNQAQFEIKKDGTWKRTISSTSSYQGGASTTSITVTSGTWSFIGTTKGDDFKKNERVVFNVLSYNYNNGESSESYLTGEQAEFYTVIESKPKLLKLESNSQGSEVSGGSTDSHTGKVTYTLEK